MSAEVPNELTTQVARHIERTEKLAAEATPLGRHAPRIDTETLRPEVDVNTISLFEPPRK